MGKGEREREFLECHPSPAPDFMCVVCTWAASVSSSVTWGECWSEVPNSLVFQGKVAKGIASKLSLFPAQERTHFGLAGSQRFKIRKGIWSQENLQGPSLL